MATKATGKPEVKNAGTTQQVAPQAKVTKKINMANARDPHWYLTHEGELEDVTAERSNPAIGVNDIIINPASDAQMAYYTIANVTLNTVVGTITGVQVKESEHTPGSLYITTNSRNIAKDKEKDAPRWINDVKLDRKVQAQVLSYVNSMLVPAE